MRTFKGWVETNKQGSLVEFEFEVSNDATETDIEQEFKEARSDCMDSGYTEVGNDI